MFFFSSRRRHTRWPRDWSSDVCSSDLYPLVDEPAVLVWLAQLAALEIHTPQWRFDDDDAESNPDRLVLDLRSEERRVGKEWRSGGKGSGVRRKKRGNRWVYARADK